MPTRWKVSKPVRLAIWLLEYLLAVALAALIIMSTGWFQHVLERRVIAGLEHLTGGRVEIAHFRFRPWLFQIRAQGLVIHGSEPTTDPPLLSVHDVEAGVSPTQLLRQRIRLRHLDIDELQVHLLSDAHGITNLPQPEEQVSPRQGLTGLMDLSIGRLTISHSAVFWNDLKHPLGIEAKDLAILLGMTQGRYAGTLSSSATTIRSPRWSTASINFHSRFELSRTSLALSSLVWQTQGTSGEVSVKILLRPDLLASGEFHASAEIPALARVFDAPELRAGTLKLDGLGVYQRGSLSVQGRAQAHQLTISTPAYPSLRLDATTSYALDKNQISLTNLLVSIWGGTAQGTLQVNLDGSPAKFHLNSQVRGVRLDNALTCARTPPLLVEALHPASLADGTLTAAWTGPDENLHADFDLSLRGPTSASPGLLPVSGAARGSLEGGHGLLIHVTDAELRTPHSTVTARGSLAQTGGSPDPLALTVSTDDFEEWRHFFQALISDPSGIPLKINSRAEFSGELSGSAADPALRGQVTSGPFEYHGWTWDRLTAGVVLNPSLIQVSEARVIHSKSTFEVNGSARLDEWRFTPKSQIQFSAQAQRTPVEGLKTMVNSDLPLRGFITGRLDVEGTTATLAGSGSLRIDDGAIADEPFDFVSARLQVTRSVWKLQDVQLAKGRGRASGNVSLEPERHFASGQLQGTDFRLADIRRLPTPDSTVLPKGGLDGLFSFELSGHGVPDDLHLQSAWRFRNLSLAGTAMGDLQGTLTGEGKQLTVEGDDQGTEGSLHLRAHANAGGDWPMEAEGEYSRVRADPWIRAFFEREFGAAVTLAGTFHVSGPLRRPAKIEVQSRVREVVEDFPSMQWRNAAPFDVHYADGWLALNRFVVRGPSTELAVEGGVRFANGVSLSLGAEGAADATLLTVFDPHLQVSGRSTLHMRLTGAPDRPIMTGALNIQDMSLGYKELPFRFNNLQGTLSLEGERAVIRSLRGTSGGGTVNLTGFVTLAESPRFEVRADLSQVRMPYPPNFTSVFDGHLRLGGGADQAQLQGDLMVRQMVMNGNVNFISKIIESSNPLPDQTPSVSSPIASKIRLSIRVTSAPPVQLQTPNLRLVGDIDLRIQGSVANPVQVGSIHFLNGETVFRGNRYTLVRGDMSMTNPFRTQAYLDMEAQTRVQSYDVTLDISGPFDRLKFSYRSDPPLGNADIVSLLALGYVQQEQAFAAAGGNPTATIGASAILSEALSSQVTGRIQHLFGVSRIKIDPNVSVPGFGAGARVTVEQQVSHDLTLTYVTDTSYSQYRIIQFEWNVSDNVSVLGIRDQNGVFGLEFRFRRRFK